MARGGPRELPSGTVCFLFTDVESSTTLLRSLGETQWALIQERVQAIVRNAVERNNGVVVNTEGDGSFVAFGSADAALRSAREAQHAISDSNFIGADVRVRMGLHMGFDVTPRDDDYVALAVHQAARVAAAANGGQVLATEDVLTGAPHAELTDLGLFTVRDFDGPVRLYELVHDADSRTPRVPSAFDTQVPQYRHALVGRDTEIADVVRLLGERSSVSLVGPAGVGKTRLAVAVLSQVSSELNAGPWFVDLTEAREPARVGDVVAAAVGCPPGTDIGVHLDGLLDDRRGLMVLDHCEHLLDAARSVALLLVDWCPTLQLVATSTEPLGVPAERVYRVEPLAPPASTDPADVLDSSSGRLFTERVAAVHEAFDVTEHAGAIERVCKAVGGVPLAIELAAAMYEPSAPDAVLARIGDGSLTTVIDASIAGLAGSDAQALAALAVAESPIAAPLAAVSLTSIGIAPGDVATVLARLVRSSLLRLDPDGQHSLLETVRSRLGDHLTQRANVLRALLEKCLEMLGDSSGPLSRFEPVAATAAMLLREETLPAYARQRLAFELAPWWIGRLGRARARDLLLSALALDASGPAAAAIHLAVADTYEQGAETVDTEWHVQRAAVLLGEHDAVDPAMIERLKNAAVRGRRGESADQER